MKNTLFIAAILSLALFVVPVVGQGEPVTPEQSTSPAEPENFAAKEIGARYI